MARSLKQRQKNANGSVAPAKIPEGQQPSKPQTGCPTDTTKTSRKSRIKTCSTCGHTATKLAEMRSHFAGCVEVNGTPTGGQKDFGFTFMPPSHLAKRKFDDLDDDNANANTPPASKRSARGPTTAEQRAERQRLFHERLAAVNGIIIPSKLAPDQTPIRKIVERGDCRTHQCSICGSLHNSHYHVQSHFATCVKRNGNPNGARWDDAWNGAAFRTSVVSAQVSQEPQDDEMQDLQPEEFELASLQLDDSEMEDVPVDDQQHSKLQSVYSPADDFKTYHPNFKSLDRHPMSSSLNSPEHHPDLKYFDPLSPSSEGSGPYHPDVDHLDTQASSPDGLPPYTRFPPIDGDISLPRIEIMAKEVFLSMARVSKNPT